MTRNARELNRIINQCVLNTLMTIKLFGQNDGFDELTMIKCVAIRLDQVTDDICSSSKPLEDFDIDYYIDAYIERWNMSDVEYKVEDNSNDQENV